jgi:drug/metabolite transporter (DMT)-like permease
MPLGGDVTTPARPRRWALVLLFVTPALWSVNYIVARVAAGVVAPHMLAFCRWLLAGVLLAAIARQGIWTHRHAIRQEWPQLLVLGALGMWICGAFVYIGGHTTTATNISLIYALSPVLIALISPVLVGERLTRAQKVGVGISLLGFFHVVLAGQWGNLADVRFTPGDWWILSAAVSWAAYTLLMKRWRSAFDPTARLALVSAAGLVVLLPLTVVEAWLFASSEVSWRAAGYIGAAALFPAFGAYLAYSFLLRELGAARAGVVLYLGPVYVALLAWLVLGEPIRRFHFIGAALILSGVYLATREK